MARSYVITCGKPKPATHAIMPSAPMRQADRRDRSKQSCYFSLEDY
jgi:hypothetical protein